MRSTVGFGFWAIRIKLNFVIQLLLFCSQGTLVFPSHVLSMSLLYIYTNRKHKRISKDIHKDLLLQRNYNIFYLQMHYESMEILEGYQCKEKCKSQRF